MVTLELAASDADDGVVRVPFTAAASRDTPGVADGEVDEEGDEEEEEKKERGDLGVTVEKLAVCSVMLALLGNSVAFVLGEGVMLVSYAVVVFVVVVVLVFVGVVLLVYVGVAVLVFAGLVVVFAGVGAGLVADVATAFEEVFSIAAGDAAAAAAADVVVADGGGVDCDGDVDDNGVDNDGAVDDGDDATLLFLLRVVICFVGCVTVAFDGGICVVAGFVSGGDGLAEGLTAVNVVKTPVAVVTSFGGSEFAATTVHHPVSSRKLPNHRMASSVTCTRDPLLKFKLK